MRMPLSFAVALLAASLSLACNSAPPAAPSQATPAATAASSTGLGLTSNQSITRTVSMMDACDGPTFNAAVGAGDCLRNHGILFSDFIAMLSAQQSVGSWHFGPPQTDGMLGDSIVATNNGGEVHTFTRVANFGGGVVPILNTLSGAGAEVPECAAETHYVPPGGTDTDSLNQAGELKFQCCIHPWMKTTVLVKSH